MVSFAAFFQLLSTVKLRPAGAWDERWACKIQVLICGQFGGRERGTTHTRTVASVGVKGLTRNLVVRGAQKCHAQVGATCLRLHKRCQVRVGGRLKRLGVCPNIRSQRVRGTLAREQTHRGEVSGWWGTWRTRARRRAPHRHARAQARCGTYYPPSGWRATRQRAALPCGRLGRNRGLACQCPTWAQSRSPAGCTPSRRRRCRAIVNCACVRVGVCMWDTKKEKERKRLWRESTLVEASCSYYWSATRVPRFGRCNTRIVPTVPTELPKAAGVSFHAVEADTLSEGGAEDDARVVNSTAASSVRAGGCGNAAGSCIAYLACLPRGWCYRA